MDWLIVLLISTSDNTEIGNGYGVPGGGAYFDASRLSANAGKQCFNFQKCLT